MRADSPLLGIGELARAARTAAYRLASPVESALRALTGGRRLPPLWLRRHTGPVGAFESAARDTAAWLDRLDILSGCRLVLDAGCGAGAMVEELLARLPPDARYVGFDVHEPSIRWCRRRFRGQPRARFELASVASPYGAADGAPASSYRFPVPDGEADLVLAKSLFTHLLDKDARHYLRETRRALRPGRAAVVTAFLFETGTDGLEGAFPHAAPGGSRARVRSRARPEAAVAWEKAAFVEMIEEAGLHVQWHSHGFYPGRRAIDAQDVLLLGV
jgi:SAM-dependent methyltransferase